MSGDLPCASASASAGGGESGTGAKVVYYLDDEDTPFLISLRAAPSMATLADLKRELNRPPNTKFFFEKHDADIGRVKEEIRDDTARLPLCELGQSQVVKAYLVTADSSSHSDNSGGTGSRQKRGSGGGGPATLHTDLAALSINKAANNAYATAAADFDATAATTDTESTVSGIPNFAKLRGVPINRRLVQPQFGIAGSQRMLRGAVGGGSGLNDSTLTESDAARQMFDSEDDQSRVSTSTDITSVSQMRPRMKRRKPRKIRQAASRASSVTSITESSMSLNIISVSLNMDTVNFLGISIVGQSSQRGDGGIFVANIMKGGAVALDGRIETGDMILQVNDTPFENLSNDQAVDVLRQSVQKPGPIKLTVAKCWEPAPRAYFTIPRQDEPVRPIDPGAWVQHTNAMNALGHNPRMPSILEGSEGAPTPTPGGQFRPASASTLTSNNSADNAHLIDGPYRTQEITLDHRDHSMEYIVSVMAKKESGLEVRDRTWLKILIPNAFLGSDLVDWLHTHVQGLTERKEARKYAGALLARGLVKHTVNKITFSDQCYYVFGDSVMPEGMIGGSLASGSKMPMAFGGRHYDLSAAADDQESTVAPLPPPPPHAAAAAAAAAPAWTHAGRLANATPSMASGYASMPFQYNGGGSFGSLPGAPPSHMGALPTAPPLSSSTAAHVPLNAYQLANAAATSEAHSAASGGSSGGSEKRAKLTAVAPPSIPPKPVNGNVRAIDEVPGDLAASRASFRMAMGNPCEFFVDLM